MKSMVKLVLLGMFMGITMSCASVVLEDNVEEVVEQEERFDPQSYGEGFHLIDNGVFLYVCGTTEILFLNWDAAMEGAYVDISLASYMYDYCVNTARELYFAYMYGYVEEEYYITSMNMIYYYTVILTAIMNDGTV